MQNIDFHSRQNRNLPPHFNQNNDMPDPEYFTRMAKTQSKELERNRNKASRMLFFVTALCIISFTTGMVIGIKFVAGSSKEIVDKDTMNAVNGIGSKVKTYINKHTSGTNSSRSRSSVYSKEAYPYLIKVHGFEKKLLKDVASYLSKKGKQKYTIIVTSKNLYIPQKSKRTAQNLFDRISEYRRYLFIGKMSIIKR